MRHVRRSPGSDGIAVHDPPRRAPRRPVAWVAVVAASAATLGVALAVPTRSAPGSSPRARHAVYGLVSHSVRAQTVQLSVSATVQTDGVDATLSGSGAADFVHQDASFALHGTVAGRPQTVAIVVADGALYLDAPPIARLDPGKSWLAVPVPAHATGLGTAAGLLGNMVDPASLLPALRRAGATVEPLGITTRDGRPTTSYRVTMSGAMLGRAAAGFGVPSGWFRGVSTMRVTLDASGGLVRSLHVRTTGATSIDATVVLHGFGSPVDVAVPPAGSVVTAAQFADATPYELTAPGSLE